MRTRQARSRMSNPTPLSSAILRHHLATNLIKLEAVHWFRSLALIGILCVVSNVQRNDLLGNFAVSPILCAPTTPCVRLACTFHIETIDSYSGPLVQRADCVHAEGNCA